MAEVERLRIRRSTRAASAHAGFAGAGAAGARCRPAAALLVLVLLVLMLLVLLGDSKVLDELAGREPGLEEGRLGAPAPLVVRGCSPVQLFSREQIETFGTTLWFTYRSNILRERRPANFYANVLHTIACYNASMHGRAVARFLDDADCREMILSVSPALAKSFDMNWRGMIKADICRVAALYQSGGYYFDVDLEASRALGRATRAIALTAFRPTPPAQPHPPRQVITPMHAPEGGTVMSIWEASRVSVFQAFLASSAQHPVIAEAIRLMVLHSEGKWAVPANAWLGTATMASAFRTVVGDRQGPAEPRQSPAEPRQSPVEPRPGRPVLAAMLQEVDLGSRPDIATKNGLALRASQGTCCCNHIVVDESSGQALFWSRINRSENCNPPTPPAILALALAAAVALAAAMTLQALRTLRLLWQATGHADGHRF
jgi:hypothetical protein